LRPGGELERTAEHRVPLLELRRGEDGEDFLTRLLACLLHLRPHLLRVAAHALATLSLATLSLVAASLAALTSPGVARSAHRRPARPLSDLANHLELTGGQADLLGNVRPAKGDRSGELEIELLIALDLPGVQDLGDLPLHLDALLVHLPGAAALASLGALAALASLPALGPLAALASLPALDALAALASLATLDALATLASLSALAHLVASTSGTAGPSGRE
jgi:hypothetical protein